MTSITIDISDNQFQSLQDLAAAYGVSLDVLLRSSLEDWLSSQKNDFVNVADYVLAKNAELY